MRENKIWTRMRHIENIHRNHSNANASTLYGRIILRFSFDQQKKKKGKEHFQFIQFVFSLDSKK